MSLPDPIFRIDERERDGAPGSERTAAVLRDGDRERFFVRALLELPIDGEEGFFRYGSWIEVSPEDFEVLGELWHDEDGWRSRPFSGTLANELHPYAFTEGLPVQLRLRDVRAAPARRARRDRPRARAGATEWDLSPSRAPARRNAQSRSTGPSAYHSLNEPG